MEQMLIKNFKIVQVHVSDKTEWRHMTLEAQGHVGTGEFTIDRAGPELDSEAAAVAASLMGRSVKADFAKELASLSLRDLKGAAIVSAIDQAVNDLRARIAGLSLCEYLGAAQPGRSVPLYANVNRKTIDRTPTGFQASAQSAHDKGFGAVKIAPFDGLNPRLCGTREGDMLVDAALERVAAVRDCLPRSVPIFVDCHWRLTGRTSIEILPELSRLGVSWFECPIPEDGSTVAEIAALRRRANDFGIRLAGCETMTALEGFKPFLDAGAYDVIMPDVKYVGGIGALREVAAYAGQKGIAVSLHNPTGPICHLHSLHACVALGLTERLEMQFEETPLFETIVDPAIPSVSAGEARLPVGPGLGSALVGKSAVGPSADGSGTESAGVHA